MATSDPAPQGRARHLSKKAVTGSLPAAADPVGSVDTRLVALLDLIAERIAHHIVANPGVPCQQETAEASPSPPPPATFGATPGIPGPSPTVPADSHSQSHASPTEPRRRTRRQAKGDKESQHGSD